MTKYSGFPVHHSILKGQTLIERVLGRYDLPTPVNCHFLTQGANDTYLVHAGPSARILRVYRCGWRTRAEIMAELDMLNHLHSQRLPVSRPIKRKDGRYLTRISVPEGTRYAALFTHARGRQADMDNKESRAYGELVGRIHVCLDKVPDDARRFHLDFSHLIDEPLRHVEPFLQHRLQDLEYLKKVGDGLRPIIEGLLPRTRPEYGNCHGDHHGYNVNVDENGNMTLYDFDCYGYGWRAYDIAVFLWTRAFDESKAGRAKTTRRWNAFLEGYSSVRSLSAGELEATSAFVPMRHIWQLGLHMQVAEALGRHRLGWDSDRYFDARIGFVKRWIARYRIL